MKALTQRLLNTVLVLILIGTSFAQPCSASPLYAVTVIPPVYEGGVMLGLSINNRGQVTGSAYDDNGNSSAFLYADGVSIGLLPPGAESAWGTGINDSGQIAVTTTQSSKVFSAFLYSANSWINLGTLGGSTATTSGINNAGQVTGWASKHGARGLHAFLYNGTMNDLGSLGRFPKFGYSDGSGISDLGHVAGAAVVGVGRHGNSDTTHAFLYADGAMIDLGTLGWPSSVANAVNGADQVAGEVYSDNDSHAFLYSGGEMRDIHPTNVQAFDSYGLAINSNGIVVGHYSTYNGVVPFVFIEGEVFDLNALLDPETGSGWFLNGAATAINDRGQIVTSGYFKNSSVPSAVILTPLQNSAQRKFRR